MSSPNPLEAQVLGPATSALAAGVVANGGDHATRLEILEAVSVGYGGMSLAEFRGTDVVVRTLDVDTATAAAAPVTAALDRVSIHPALALTALAREPLSRSAQRASGAYYTDFRLARFLARGAAEGYEAGQKVIDPASGTGILLVAAALEFCEGQSEFDQFVGEAAHAADLSPQALRGVKLALAALTDDPTAIAKLNTRLRSVDSLLAGAAGWNDIAPDAFRLVIGNPPWEKLKVSRHEYITATGTARHYGADYDESTDLSSLEEARASTRAYANLVASAYGLHGGGELDLYKPFLALGADLVGPGGDVAMLVPAGLIRSHGTRRLREHLLTEAAELSITILDNKARFFAIDTRFKFLAVHAALGTPKPGRSLQLLHAAGTPEDVALTGSATIDRGTLRRMREDLTLPEVRTPTEWKLFRKMASRPSPQPLIDAGTAIVRELDMTRDRRFFSRTAVPGSLPLIEGRMVHQFRFAAKIYVSGTGRSARWDNAAIGADSPSPQFTVAVEDLPAAIRDRADAMRVGFCDVTGQTNERAMLASRIPPGVVCGNKVPTILFEDADEAWLWLAIVNSFSFDWLLRRVLTTSVNYFLLRSVPMPAVETLSGVGRRLIELAIAVDEAYHGATSATESEIADLRAEIDALVLDAYRLDEAEAGLIFKDFPLIDRGDVPLPGEARSTITRDLVLTRLHALREPQEECVAEKRVADARLLGAVGYVPTQAARGRGSLDEPKMATFA